MGVVIKRFDIYLVPLDPTIGAEMQKTRPCVVVSPDELNRPLATVLVAPMTTGYQLRSWRVTCRFQDKSGQIALDHIRSVDKSRLVKRLGRISIAEQKDLLSALAELFAE